MSRVIEAFAQFFDGDGTPLANGWLLFLETKTNNTYKATYADANLTIANANPLQLDAEGRCPNVFGQGVYRVVLYTHNPVTGLPGEMIAAFDPVQSEYLNAGASGNFTDWDTDTTYDTSQIVIYDGNYYRSIQAANYGHVPDENPDYWEQIDFIRFWNTNVTYATDDVVIYSSNLYFSLADSNQGNTPISSPLWWEPVGSGTVLLNWEESGTAFQPDTAGYDLGASGNEIGTAYITDFGTFPLTPSSDPTNDYDVANKAYVDSIGTGRMRWMGKWSAGSYVVNDVVRDNQWTMVCVADTDDRAAPLPIGESFWVQDAFDSAGFEDATSTNAVLYFGQRYTFSPSYLVEGCRIWLPESTVNFDVEVMAVIDPTGDRRITELLPRTTITDDMIGKWFNLSVNQTYIYDGTVIDAIAIIRVPEGETTFTFEWDYAKINGDPESGQINHQSGGSELRVHKEDNSAADRSAYLGNIGSGSVIYMSEYDYTWGVLEASLTGDVYTFIVTPAVRAASAVCDFTFTYFAASAIPYVYETDLFTSDTRIEGYLASEYDPDESTYFDSSSYGLDIRVQNVSSSAAWEVLAQPSVSTAGGISSADYYSSSNGPLAGFRNKSINPFFDIWQRYDGSTPFTTEGYTADRKLLNFALTGVTASVDQVDGVDIEGRFKTTYGCAVTFTDDGTADSHVLLSEHIESVNSIYGSVTVTIVADIPVGNSCAVVLQQYHGSGGSPSSTVVYGLLDPLEGVGAVETYIRHVVLDEPGTLGTDGEDSLRLQVWITAGSDFSSTYTDIGNQPDETVTFYAWQLEPGPAATPLEQRHISQEKNLCARYYSRFIRRTENGSIINIGSELLHVFSNTYSVGGKYTFQSEFRTVPTVSLADYTNWSAAISGSTTTYALTGDISTVTAEVDKSRISVLAPCATDLQGNVMYIGTAVLGEYIEFDAEL